VAGCIVRIGQPLRQLGRQVEASRPRNAVVNLLKKNNVGIMVPQDVRDPVEAESAVDSNASMDVVSGELKLHERRGRWKEGPIAMVSAL